MIRPQRKSIEEILTVSNVKFSVPSYQRNFDWGQGQLQELIDDLKEIVNSDDSQLFLGNFIFDVSKKNDLKIVDGQQRLTTISIIAIALREHAKRINEHELAGELQGLITLSSTWSKEQGNRISVSENIRDIFDYISRSDWDGSFPDKIGVVAIKRQVNKVKPIFQYVMEEFKSYNKEELLSFTRALMDSYVVAIEVENDDDVFSIFERTNARGLDLNVGDLLKNHIFSHGLEEFEETWEEIISNSENSLQRMLKYFWISREGHVLKSKLYGKLKSRGRDLGIKKFVEELHDFSKYYKAVSLSDSESIGSWLEDFGVGHLVTNEDQSQRITRVFQGLKLFRITQAYPLIYSLFKSYRDLTPSKPDNFINTLEALEKYHFVNNVISQKIGNEVEKFYAQNAKIFFDLKEDLPIVLNEFLLKLRLKRAIEGEFVSNFIESVTYSVKNIPIITYIFDRINNYEAKGAQRIPIYAPEKELKKRNYNVEHILPQDQKKNFDTEEDLAVFDKIGNLLVIPRHSNSEFQNKTPQEKKELMQSDIKHFGGLRYVMDFIEKYDVELREWNLNSIEERSRELARYAFEKVWAF